MRSWLPEGQKIKVKLVFFLCNVFSSKSFFCLWEKSLFLIIWFICFPTFVTTISWKVFSLINAYTTVYIVENLLSNMVMFVSWSNSVLFVLSTNTPLPLILDFSFFSNSIPCGGLLLCGALTKPLSWHCGANLTFT